MKDNINKNPIAFFDSGVGGLTVFAKVKKLLPDENYLYFGDTLHMPYGEKTEEELLKYSRNILEFFQQKNAKAVVMACNTTSAVVYEKIKCDYDFKLYPIIQSVCSSLSKLEGVKRLAVVATPATINSHVYKKEIAKYTSEMEVFEFAAPTWVKIVEEHRINESVSEIKEILDNIIKISPDKVVLACTHYPYLMSVLTQFLPQEKFIDPAVYFAQIIKDDLEKNNLINNKFDYEEFYVSSNPDNFKKSSELFYRLYNAPNLLNLNT